jgi:hypothetical protein
MNGRALLITTAGTLLLWTQVLAASAAALLHQLDVPAPVAGVGKGGARAAVPLLEAALAAVEARQR